MERVQSVIKKIESHDNAERCISLGVDCFTGAAQILSSHEVEVDGKTLSTKNIVIAIGARPTIPPVPGPDQRIKTKSDIVRHSESGHQWKVESNIARKALMSMK